MTETKQFKADYACFLSQHDVIYEKAVEPVESSITAEIRRNKRISHVKII